MDNYKPSLFISFLSRIPIINYLGFFLLPKIFYRNYFLLIMEKQDINYIELKQMITAEDEKILSQYNI